jgi:hypothetical protein
LGALQRDREVYGRRYSTIEDAVDDVRRRRRPEAFRPEPLVRPGMPAGKTPTAVEEVPMPAAKAEPSATPSDTFEDEPAAEADDPIKAESSLPERTENRLGERAVQDELLSTEEENTLGERAVQSEVEAAAEGR